MTSESPGEACGVVGVITDGHDAAARLYPGLRALQHRGEEAAGIAAMSRGRLSLAKGTGLVGEVFRDRPPSELHGDAAIGHVRYSTAGSTTVRDAQPIAQSAGGEAFALAHNGNLVNVGELARRAGAIPGASDSHLIATLVARAAASGRRLEAALAAVLPRLSGAFSLVLVAEQRIIGVRDPKGLRPLCLGRTEHGWALASETCALDAMEARFVREIRPGELVVVDRDGPRSRTPFAASEIAPSLCAFEFVYISRPDSRLYGRSVYGVRRRMGELLADESPVPPQRGASARDTMVMPVPDSGIAAAEGFAGRSGLPLGQGLVRDRYAGRSFIAPSQAKRAAKVRAKLSPLADQVAGKRLVVIDDSVVRGTTMRTLVALLRRAGAAEVHLRIASPPFRWPCFFGVDVADRDELLATGRTLAQMRRALDCDSLGHLSVTGMLAATGVEPSAFCTGCLTGRYPIRVPSQVGRAVHREAASPGACIRRSAHAL
jgi:amidophosphoribosyltransferase